ncbi:MAG: hypothetical protein RL563_59, partial [Pseudomonadota bacterium]
MSNGRAAVIRNGYQAERQIQTGIGPVSVRVPKVRAKDGQSATFLSALVQALNVGPATDALPLRA